MWEAVTFARLGGWAAMGVADNLTPRREGRAVKGNGSGGEVIGVYTNFLNVVTSLYAAICMSKPAPFFRFKRAFFFSSERAGSGDEAAYFWLVERE